MKLMNLRFPAAILVLMLTAAPSAFCQWSVGVKGGWHQNYANVNEPFEASPKANWHLGVYAQLPIAKQLYLIPELQLSNRVYDINVFVEKFRCAYMEVPIMLSYQPVTRVNVEFGPYIAFKITPPHGNSNQYPEAAFTKTFETGGAVGLRFNFTNSFSIVPRYTMGFVPAADTSLYDEFQQPLGHIELYNRTFEISLVWKSHFTRKKSTSVQ